MIIHGKITVVGSGQSGTSLVLTDATATCTVGLGEQFSIDNVNAVNPMTLSSSGQLTPKIFSFMQPWTFTGGNDTLSFVPAIVGPGSQYQNVDALPVNGAVLTLWRRDELSLKRVRRIL